MKLYCFSLIFFLFLMPLFIFGEAPALQSLYLEAKFSLITDELGKKEYSALDLPEKLLLLECLARTGRAASAEGKMNRLLVAFPRSPEVQTTAGILFFSLGRIQDAKDRIEQALQLSHDFPPALLAKVPLLLYLRNFENAENCYQRMLTLCPEWKKSYFMYFLGLEVYSCSQNLQALTRLYKLNANRTKKNNRERSDSMKADSNLYKKIGGKQLFQMETSSDKIVFPLKENSQDKRSNILFITVKEKTYKMLLDTGNRAGWIIHNQDLREDLKVKKGGSILTEIGTESGVMDGYRIYAKSLKLKNLQINNLVGLYVPKPRPDFYDANLNPVFIRDRVVTIDFISKQLFLRTKEKYDQDLDAVPSHRYTKLPWYGYRSGYIPVQINTRDGLAMIETGAQDIGIKLDFAHKLGLSLLPKTRYLPDGKVYTYYKTGIKMAAGPFSFERNAAEVWPFDRFYDHLTGLTADVYIGPLALAGRFSITFDPFDNKIILSRE